ncbi:MAG: hypothetical protein EHM72_14775, partial [Calditrichaeota bacterium]
MIDLAVKPDVVWLQNRSIILSLKNIKPMGVQMALKTVTFMLFLCCFTFASETISLDGLWKFNVDPRDIGLENEWFSPSFHDDDWRQVAVPHTWQVDAGFEDYFGVGWYRRTFQTVSPADARLVLEFDAVYRDCIIWINGQMIGNHSGSGWTPFSFEIPPNSDGKYQMAIRVDNSFSERALPYKDSFDWANDGGIIRSVRLCKLPQQHLSHLMASAIPSADFRTAEVKGSVQVHGHKADKVSITLYDPNGNSVGHFTADAADTVHFSLQVVEPQLWHFDYPHLYHLEAQLIDQDRAIHSLDSNLGIRRIVVKDGYYWLNDEPMRLMGVEWMPGSDPRYGMAESPEYMRTILDDMKRLNCLITRFHWQQDKSVFDFCDHHGILVQEEIPTWGGATKLEDLADIQRAQMNEMIIPHFNHPSIYAWGLCNEIRGLEPAGHKFVLDGMAIGRKLDPYRLLTYASNTLHNAPANDAARYLDFIEWNEYFESWYGGSAADAGEKLKLMQQQLPHLSVVVSEYGLCECTPDNPVGDPRRIEILKTHTDIYRQHPNVAGAIFFDYNDYRTHIGDKGKGAYKQRVHGVVDVFKRPKPSWDALRDEMSPIKTMTISTGAASTTLTSMKVAI